MTRPDQPTADLIAVVRAALAAATPGPWRMSAVVLDKRKTPIACATGPDHLVEPDADGLSPLVEADAALIAAAPAWLAEIATRLERAEDEARASFNRGRAEGRGDVAKYSNAIGRIESLLGYAGARPMAETVAAVAALKARAEAAEARVAELESGTTVVATFVSDDYQQRMGYAAAERDIVAMALAESRDMAKQAVGPAKADYWRGYMTGFNTLANWIETGEHRPAATEGGT